MRAGATIGRVPLRCEGRSQPRRQRMLIAAAAEQGQATNPVRVARLQIVRIKLRQVPQPLPVQDFQLAMGAADQTAAS
jgi:hypothetical protein